jgi:hypothetical protein
MKRYDPLREPDRSDWLETDEQVRVLIVEEYHKKHRIELPNHALHAGIHTIVENQLAEGLPVPCETLLRLMHEGLDRHDAIHAIGSVLTEHIFALLNSGTANSDSNDQYYQSLHDLTAAKWLSMAE